MASRTTIYVQKKAGRQRGYSTLYATDDAGFATFLAEQIGGRTISKTNLLSSMGLEGLSKAIEETLTDPIPEGELNEYKAKYQLSPAVEETKDFLIRLPLSYHKKIKKLAQVEGRSMSYWITEAIRERLKASGVVE